MSEKSELKNASRMIFLFYTEDGLIDLAIGLVIFGFGGLLILDMPGFVGVLGLVSIGLWYLGKRFICMPRTGIIRLEQAMQKKLTGFFVVMIILGIGVLSMLFTRLGSLKPGGHPLMMLALVLALGISVLGLIMKVNRLYFYAILIFAAFSGGAVMNGLVEGSDVFILSVIGTGLIILAAGTVVLARFIRKYPIVEEEA